MTSLISCEGVAGGEWDEAFTGLWYESGDNYILEEFFEEVGDGSKSFIFDGASISIIMNANQDDCICGDDATSEEIASNLCVEHADGCIWLNEYCVSLNFSK